MKLTPRKSKSASASSANSGSIRLVAPPSPEQIEQAIAVIAQARLAHIARLEDEIEQQLWTLSLLSRDSSPLRKALDAFTGSLTVLSAARRTAQNIALPAAIRANGGAR